MLCRKKTLESSSVPIHRKGKFLVWPEHWETPSLGIETKRIDACIKEVRRKNYKGVFGSPAFGFRQNNLDFLADIPHLMHVWFWATELKNIDGLYALTNLTRCNAGEKRPKIDYSRLSNLDTLIWHHRTSDMGVGALKRLRQLDLWRFKKISFAEISLPGSLEKLDVNWCSIAGVKGLQRLERLKEIQFHYCRNLQTLEGLEDIAPNLERLIVTRCNNFTAELDLTRFPNIKHVFVKNKRLTG